MDTPPPRNFLPRSAESPARGVGGVVGPGRRARRAASPTRSASRASPRPECPAPSWCSEVFRWLVARTTTPRQSGARRAGLWLQATTPCACAVYGATSTYVRGLPRLDSTLIRTEGHCETCISGDLCRTEKGRASVRRPPLWSASREGKLSAIRSLPCRSRSRCPSRPCTGSGRPARASRREPA